MSLMRTRKNSGKSCTIGDTRPMTGLSFRWVIRFAFPEDRVSLNKGFYRTGVMMSL